MTIAAAEANESLTEDSLLDVWVDPACPWAWVVSRWLLEVQEVRPVRFGWRILSLSLLNEGKEFPEDIQRAFEAGLGIVRVMQAAIDEQGEQVTFPLYDAIGRRIHEQGRGYFGKPVDPTEVAREVVAESLAECGLPEDLMKTWGDSSRDDALRDSLSAAHAAAGTEVGTPVVSIPSVEESGAVFAYFGPVLSRIPRGEDAGKLWDGLRVVAGNPAFSELKRGRTEGPKFE